MKIKDYAESQGVSSQSIYKRIRSQKYRDRLKGHLYRDNQKVENLDLIGIKILEDYPFENDVIKLEHELNKLKETNKQEKQDMQIRIDKLADKLYHTTRQSMSENANLRRDLSVVKSENNDLSRQLLQYRETGSENLKLTQENKLLHDKVKKMEEQIKFLRKQTSIWKEKAKEFMPTAIYKETISLISTISPVGLAKTAIRQVKKMVDNNS